MIREPNCSVRDCVHFVGVRRSDLDNESTERPVCKAFPDGIPDEIAYGSNEHLTPVAGDGGIVFQKGDA